VFLFGRRHRGWGPGGWRSDRFDEWHRAAHAGGTGAASPHDPGTGGPPPAA
jgi:hypothetical protein